MIHDQASRDFTVVELLKEMPTALAVQAIAHCVHRIDRNLLHDELLAWERTTKGENP